MSEPRGADDSWDGTTSATPPTPMPDPPAPVQVRGGSLPVINAPTREERARIRSHLALARTVDLDERLVQLERILGALPTKLSAGSGALRLMAEFDVKLDALKLGFDGKIDALVLGVEALRAELARDRKADEEREAARVTAVKDAQKAEIERRAPVKDVGTAVLKAVLISVTLGFVGLVGGFVATHWTWSVAAPALQAPH